MYENGQGLPRDAVQAAAWCRRAADQGIEGAQLMLGTMYVEGWGCRRTM
jgi:uncharacterized protein